MNVVPYIPQFVNQQEIEAGVQRAVQALAPTVVRIRYSFEADWTGDPSIFFRVVLRDEAAKKSKLAGIAERIMFILRREVKPEDHGLQAYFNFRTLSEQNEINEPAWA
jgi:hypothetical protein